MSASINIKNQIIKRIETLDAIEVVYPTAIVDDKGWPAASVVPTSEQGEFVSNSSNSRIYSYDCTILFPMGSDFIPPEEMERLDYCEVVIADCIDQVITIIDEGFELDGPPTVLFVQAADVTWEYYQYAGGVARAATVVLNVYTEVEIL